MTIPIVTEDVCIALNDELVRKGATHLHTSLNGIMQKQPVLTMAIGIFVDKFTEIHGKLAAESMVRFLVFQYKLIENQFEVNDLEEQATL
ncbi:hypothetical protein LCGC14_2271820 [marine sediment metagenome]|uniref:Uncharacterized protein n=1 Tax=marine sediment metagenome TaxID=412755 RepID=A0A0F9CX10_9ZZZZ